MPEEAKPQATEADLPPVVVKKYANRRLYNTESSSYITLDTLAEMVRVGRDFVVLTQIIVEEEGKGRAMLPTGFLRQLIGFYGNSLQGLVPNYLEQAMTSFASQQEQMRQAMQQTMGSFFPFRVDEVGRQNMAMMERAMSLFSPFYPGDGKDMPRPSATEAAGQAVEEELAMLRAEIETLRAKLAEQPPASKKAVK